MFLKSETNNINHYSATYNHFKIMFNILQSNYFLLKKLSHSYYICIYRYLKNKFTVYITMYYEKKVINSDGHQFHKNINKTFYHLSF